VTLEVGDSLLELVDALLSDRFLGVGRGAGLDGTGLTAGDL
jgi:hypothetical protein